MPSFYINGEFLECNINILMRCPMPCHMGNSKSFFTSENVQKNDFVPPAEADATVTGYWPAGRERA